MPQEPAAVMAEETEETAELMDIREQEAVAPEVVLPARRAPPNLLGTPMAPPPKKKKKSGTEDAAERLLLPKVRIKLKSRTWTIGPLGFSKYVDARHCAFTICNECLATENKTHAEFLCGRDNSPTNAKHHLQSHHPDLYDQLLLAIEADKQVSTSITVNKTSFIGNADIDNFKLFPTG